VVTILKVGFIETISYKLFSYLILTSFFFLEEKKKSIIFALISICYLLFSRTKRRK